MLRGVNSMWYISLQSLELYTMYVQQHTERQHWDIVIINYKYYEETVSKKMYTKETLLVKLQG